VAASTEVLIGGAGAQHVLIRPLSRSTPGLFDAGERDGIDCEIEIGAGSFQGRFRADIRSDEFQTFLEQIEALTAAPDGTASLTSMEGQMAVSFSGDGRGRIRVAGEAVDVAGADSRLQFGFEVDSASLSEIARSLEHLLAAFPVRAAPDA
jgi:hypothetical protein